MDLQEAQTLACSISSPQDETLSDVLFMLAQSATQAQQAYTQQHDVTAQQQLENTFLYLLNAFNRLDLDLQRGLYRAMTRLKQFKGERAFHIFEDRVEIRVGQVWRGGWSIYSQEDYQHALALAAEMNATVIYAQGKQLELFKGA
jgi:histidinol dehydrogenase